MMMTPFAGRASCPPIVSESFLGKAGARSHRGNLWQVGAKRYYTGITVPAPARPALGVLPNPLGMVDAVGDWDGPQLVDVEHRPGSPFHPPKMVVFFNFL